MNIVQLPVEDMYPRPGARPLDSRLVAEITESMDVLGFVESQAVVVRPSGNLYTIIDGQHRIEAARALGITTAPARVVNVSPSRALALEGALNKQRPDTEEEKYQRAQDFFDLGAALVPQEVSVATGLIPELQERVRRARAVVNDPVAVRDLSFPRLFAIDDFAYDEEAWKRILHAHEKEWRAVVRELRGHPESGIPEAEDAHYSVSWSHYGHFVVRLRGEDEPVARLIPTQGQAERIKAVYEEAGVV